MTRGNIERTEQFRIRMSEDEMNMLRMLATAAGLTNSDQVRTWIRSAYRERFGDRKPVPPKR